MFDFANFIPLTCAVRHYDWGERQVGDSTPLIADLLQQNTDAATPWAELWIGAHPAGSAMLQLPDGDVSLYDLIKEQPMSILGESDATRQLPFLLKILCCEQSLSVQSHPDRVHAQRLHASEPAHYPDCNHKPEIIIAISPFRAMAGFRTSAAAAADVRPRQSLAVWHQQWSEAQPSLRQQCETLFAIPNAALPPLFADLRREIDADSNATAADRLCLELLTQHQNDRGALFAYLLQEKKLQPGEALYLPPNTPHAYLYGQGIECMASSDNVIRAGLTPKFIDVQALLDTVTFMPDQALAIAPDDKLPGHQIYQTPATEFQVEILSNVSINVSDYPATAILLLVFAGSALISVPGQPPQAASRGSVWLKPACLRHGLLQPQSSDTKIILVRAKETV